MYLCVSGREMGKNKGAVCLDPVRQKEKRTLFICCRLYVYALAHSSPLTVGVNGNSFLRYNNIVSCWWKLLYFLYLDTHRSRECITEGVCKCKLIGLTAADQSLLFSLFEVCEMKLLLQPLNETEMEINFEISPFRLQKWLSANVRLAWCLVEKVPLNVCFHQWMFCQCFTSSKLWIVTQFNFQVCQVCTLTITQH